MNVTVARESTPRRLTVADVEAIVEAGIRAQRPASGLALRRPERGAGVIPKLRRNFASDRCARLWRQTAGELR